jgi:hypothetical protein
MMWAWPVSRWAAPTLTGFVLGCGIGPGLANGLGVGGFWATFAVGLLVGVCLAVLASGFVVALFCAACGTMSAVATLGATVRAPEGWLTPGGRVDTPVIDVVLETVLFVAAMIAQVALAPEELTTIKRDFQWP